MADSRQNAGRAFELEKERQIMKELFREKREKILKHSKISLDTDRFVREQNDLNKKLAKDTVGLVHLNQFQKIREDIEKEAENGLSREDSLEAEEEKLRKRLQKDAARLSFDVEELLEANDSSIEQEELTLSLINKQKRGRLGVDPNVKCYYESSCFETANQDVKNRKIEADEQEAQESKRRAQIIRLTLSFYDGADHRFFVDFRRGDSVSELLKKSQREYGPLRGILVEDLMFVKENLILPSSTSIFELEKMGALKDGGRGPYHNSDLFSFALQLKDQKSVAEAMAAGTAPPTAFDPDEMIETDATRNAKICSKAWFARNKHLIPAKYWIPFDSSKHCRKQTS